ncbi:MAG: polyprenyl synthetase family protein [Lentisphaeria bacterium]|nr:polyprenyl synthetase family protein [Lentisphaeria bacterium]
MALPEQDAPSQQAFKAYLAQVAEQVASFLHDDMAVRTPSVPEHLRDTADSYLRQPGKCLRPALLQLCCAAAGGNAQAVLPAAAAVEVYHTWTLVHDDIIDHDAFRRGQPTAHISGAALGRKRWGLADAVAADYGVSLAILAGDLLQGRALSLLASVPARAELALALVRRMSDWLTPELLAGEQLDIELSHCPWEDISEENIITMMRQKTGALLAFCATTGVALAEDSSPQDSPVAQAMGRCAELCGLAFQIQDDLLGLSGEEVSFGKPIGSDIREGKRTMVMRHAMAYCSAAERRLLTGILGNADASGEDIAAVREVVTRTGSDVYARTCTERFLVEALQLLESTLRPTPQRELLRSWIMAMVRRNR